MIPQAAARRSLEQSAALEQEENNLLESFFWCNNKDLTYNEIKIALFCFKAIDPLHELHLYLNNIHTS